MFRIISAITKPQIAHIPNHPVKSVQKDLSRGLKTRKAVAKRFKVTKEGIKFKHANLTHKMSKYSRKRNKRLQQKAVLTPEHNDYRRMKRTMGF